jgi:hypothetical protein
MPITLESVVRQARDVLMTEAAGEAVLLDLKSDMYFGLDDVGTQMWQAVLNSPNLRAAHQHLLSAYQVDSNVLEQDLLRWLEEMTDHGLLEVVDA